MSGPVDDEVDGWVLPETRPSVYTFRYGIEARGLEFEIEIDRGDDFALAGQPGKQALAVACRARRICVSVMRTREPGKW